MSAQLGKRIRMARLFGGAAGRAMCLALDHGMQLGPIAGVEDPRTVIDQAVSVGVDGIILTPGIMLKCGDLLAGRSRPSVILRLDQTTMWRVGGTLGYLSGHTRLVASVEEAVQMGADAVITYFFVGHREPELETQSIAIAAEVTRAARRWGIVHVAEPMAARDGLAKDVFDPEVVAMHNRMAAEMGADIVKTDWSGSSESFARVVATAQAPVVVAGGASLGDDVKTLAMVDEIRSSGAAGVLFGRNVFQSPDPARLMRAMRAMLHDDLPLAEAKAQVA